MSGPMIEFAFRAMIFLAIFLIAAYFLFRHIEKVKMKYGSIEESDNYLAILKHYFMREYGGSGKE